MKKKKVYFDLKKSKADFREHHKEWQSKYPWKSSSAKAIKTLMNLSNQLFQNPEN